MTLGVIGGVRLQVWIVVILMGLVVMSIGVYPIWVEWRRQRWRSRPFPFAWQVVVERHLPLYRYLSNAQQQQLQGHIQVLLSEKQFIGCQGLVVSTEMRVTIAAIASLLLFGEQPQYFPNLRSILVYPAAYQVTETLMNEQAIIEERQVIRLGESWSRDQLILSWEQVQYDCDHWRDGHNVVLHEFAHQLDQTDGSIQGVPRLPPRIDPVQWETVMRSAYLRLRADVEQGARPTLDPYGATQPAEFFAVATEAFFEQPHQLQHTESELYALLAAYYGLDPAIWG
ncbi:M90 family metallopeptidase [Trichothermofontia sp.]